jgi:hypothetical protein
MAAGNTYEAIATTTLGSDTASVTLSSIPSTYTDLICLITVKASADSYFFYRVNSDSGSNYSDTQLVGNGTSASSTRNANQTGIQLASTAVMNKVDFSPFIIQINNYSNTTTYKTFLTRANNLGIDVFVSSGLWRSTAAINSITFTKNNAASYSAGSTFTLYGIKAA